MKLLLFICVRCCGILRLITTFHFGFVLNRVQHPGVTLTAKKDRTMLRRTLETISLMLVGIILSTPVWGQDLEAFEEKVTEFQLDNGLTFIVVERHAAPVASFVTFVNVGGANEPVGNTGIAHIFEHMAFKGTHTIGTTNWEKEKPLIEKMDKAYRAWLNEKHKPETDSTVLEEKWQEFQEFQEKSQQYVKNNEFSRIIEQNGGTGLNAYTNSDETAYFYSLPSNKAELWFSLEADRFKNPVFREFYTEKEVVREERRMRTESSPQGRLIEEFLAVAYTAHPYGRPVVGWNSDITATTIKDAKKFYDTYYVPSNITFGISGDVDPEQVKEWAELYFGDIPKAEPAPPVTTKEPEQRGERRFEIIGQAQPFYLTGYHTVTNRHEDAEAMNLLSSILSDGRTSRLYKRLVDEDESALAVIAFNGFPGTKYESLFLTFTVPNRGVEISKIEKTINEEIQKVKDGAITQEELERARTKARADLIRSLDDNSGLALSLAKNEAQNGDWRTVFTRLDKLEAVTLDDLQRVAKKYLVKQNRTVGILKNKEDAKEVADANK